MIVAGSRDGRKGVGLGFDTGRDMDDTELEEGEAFSYQNNDDSAIDPDVALSYIDEKLQHVLGHFQKDFEGGVSAENLGAKFGGYGSFLPAYQRSPVGSHKRAPPDVYNITKFSDPLYPEVDSSGKTLSGRPGSVSVTAASVPALGASSIDDSDKGDRCTSSTCAKDGLTLLDEPWNMSLKPSINKCLKVRIKGNSGNLSTGRNAEIYSGLGLDVSSSSSMDDSHTDSEGIFHEPLDTPDESLRSILQIMTSFPVDGCMLLSPLPDDLIWMTEREKPRMESKSEPMNDEGLKNSLMLVNGVDFARGNREILGEKKPISSDKNALPMELEGNGYDAQNSIGIALEKETDIDTLSCEELVSNVVKLPLLSKLNCNTVGFDRRTAKAVDITSYDLAKEESEPILTQQISQVEKPNGKVGPAGKVREAKMPFDDNSVQPRRGGKSEGEKSDILTKADLNDFNGREAIDAELPVKEKAAQVATPHNENGKQHYYIGKKNSKESQSYDSQEAKVSSNIDSSVVPKSRKSGDGKSFIFKSEKEDFRKGSGKARDRYRDFFGDLDLEGDLETTSEKMPSSNRPNHIEVVGKNNFKFNSSSKDRPNGKIMNRPSMPESHPTVASNEATIAGNRHIPDMAPAVITPLVQEDWVCCDKCQSWRLLPLGTDPESLPEKWVCSMLYWLPGMNRCSVSEDETTKALRALYQLPATALDGQSSLHDNPGKILPGASSVDVQHLEQKYRHAILHSKPSSAKKKDRFKDGTYAIKNLQAPLKNRSLNGTNQSPSMDELGFQHLGQSSNITGEKYGVKQKAKNEILDSYSNGGDKKNAKMRNKREGGGSRPSKKAKMDDMLYNNEDSGSGHGGIKLKMDHRLGCDISLRASEKFCPKYNGISKDSNCDAKGNITAHAGISEEWVQMNSDNQLPHTGKFSDDGKKRKVSEYQGAQSYNISFPRDGHHIQDCSNFIEETCENGQNKKKKAKMSCYEEKEITGSKVNAKTNKKGKNRRDQQGGPDLGTTLSHRSIDTLGSLKRDLGSMPATSSSSKVSGSHKNKSSLQVKGSPVESVSSSPLRVLCPGKFTSRTNLVGRDDSQKADNVAIASPRRCSDVEDGDRGRDRSGTVRREDILNVVQASDHCHDEGRENDHALCANGSDSKKSGKGSLLSRFKEKNHISRSEVKKGKSRNSDLVSASIDCTPSLGEKLNSSRNKFQEKSRVSSDKVDKNFVSEKDSARRPLSDTCKKESHSKFGGKDNLHVKLDAPIRHAKKNMVMDCHGNGKSSNRLLSDNKDCNEIYEMGKNHSVPSYARIENEMVTYCPESQKGNGQNISLTDASEGSGALKLPKQIKKVENQNGNQPINSRHITNRNKARDTDDSSSQDAINVVKEAKDLKHMADRLKNSGSCLESTGLYFRAALKFLRGASLLESSNNDSTKHAESQVMELYSSTAKLCEFCAHEFEKSKEMAAAALAYKCMEVAYMRVTYSSHGSSSRARHELQTTLQIVPSGESPSSSASDVDNLNNPTTLHKVAPAKGVSSPLVAGCQVISAQNRNSISRLLNFAQNVNFAMEASRKSRIAFAAANQGKEGTDSQESVSSIKRALDFNFQDVEGFLRLVRHAMGAISHEMES